MGDRETISPELRHQTVFQTPDYETELGRLEVKRLVRRLEEQSWMRELNGGTAGENVTEDTVGENLRHEVCWRSNTEFPFPSGSSDTASLLLLVTGKPPPGKSRSVVAHPSCLRKFFLTLSESASL